MTVTNREFRMTQETIDAWARLSGDYNPLHVDPEFASRTRFGGTIAHGHIALAMIEDLMLEIVGDSWIRGGELIGARFTAPVRPENDYCLTATPDGDGGWAVEVKDAVDDQLCVTAVARAPET